MKKRNPEEKYRKNIEKTVKLSPFIVRDRADEIIFFADPPCPKCNGWMGGEFAGVFSCEFCGYSEDSDFASPHGSSYLLEGTWKLLNHFLFNKRLKYEVSRCLYRIYSELRHWYQLGRHRVLLTVDNYLYDWKKKRWVKFM